MGGCMIHDEIRGLRRSGPWGWRLDGRWILSLGLRNLGGRYGRGLGGDRAKCAL